MHDILSHEESLRLIALAREGEEWAEERLVSCNLALVKSIVRRYMGRGVEYDDLYQLGCLGLVKAVKNYDISYGVRFTTYAVPLISGEIKRFLRDDGIIRVSRSMKELGARVMAAKDMLLIRLGREARILEIAEELKERVEDVALAMSAMSPCTSLDEPVFGDESDVNLMDRIVDENTSCETEVINRLFVKELVETLDNREQLLIILRYYRGKTQSEVAKRLGVSQVQVSRMEARIIKKLREQVK